MACALHKVPGHVQETHQCVHMYRKAEFYITVQRKPGVNLSPDSNCSFGMTVGSIEAKSDTAKCWDFRRIKRGEAAAARIPNCREVMPQLNSYQQPDTSAQATFVVALIGLGILVLALVVLGGVLARRWSRRKAQKAKDLELDFGGVQPGQTGAPTSLVLAAMMQPETTGVVALAVEPAEPRSVDEPRRKQRAAGGRTKEDRQRLERRMMQIEDGVDEEVDDGELGANAGILEGLGSSVSMQFKQGRGGSKLVMGGGKVTGSRATDRPGSGSSGSGSEAGRASPADELYRSRLTARQVPGSPGGSRVPTPPEESKGARGQAPRRKPGVTGAVGGEDIEFSIKHRPGTNSSSGSAADWEDSTGIKIDDILQQARSAAAIAAANGRASAANGKGTPDRSRAWKPGDRSPASSDKAGSSSSGSGPHDLGAQRAKQSEPVPPELPPPPKAPSAVPARPPVMAPLMAARLGIKPQQAVGGRTMAPLGSNGPTSPTGPSKMEPSPGQARTVMLQSVLPQQRSVAALPMAGQAGVPMPPPRGNGSVPSSRNIGGQAFGLNGNGRSSASPAAAEAGWGTGNTGPPAPGAGPLAPGAAAGAWRTPTGTPAQAASRPLVGQAVNGNARPPLGGAGPRGGMGSNGRDGRGMVRIGGGRGAPEEHVLEEEDR